MKVVKKGHKQKGWAKEFQCTGIGNSGGCGATLLVEEADIFQTSSTCRDETNYFNTFKCPECGILTDITGRIPFNPPPKKVWELKNYEVDISNIK